MQVQERPSFLASHKHTGKVFAWISPECLKVSPQVIIGTLRTSAPNVTCSFGCLSVACFMCSHLWCEVVLRRLGCWEDSVWIPLAATCMLICLFTHFWGMLLFWWLVWCDWAWGISYFFECALPTILVWWLCLLLSDLDCTFKYLTHTNVL